MSPIRYGLRAPTLLISMLALARTDGFVHGQPPVNVVVRNPDNPAATAADVTTFDPDRSEVRWSDGKWLLTVGEGFVKDFDRREDDARAALRLIRDLHLTQHRTIGKGHPIIEYWLCNGQAPIGSDVRCRTLEFDLKTLRIAQANGQWTLRDERRYLFLFGSQKEAAEEALAVIRRYQFNHVAYFGQPVPLMMVFLARPVVGQGTLGSKDRAAITKPNGLQRTVVRIRQMTGLEKKDGAAGAEREGAAVGSEDLAPLTFLEARQLVKTSYQFVEHEEGRTPFEWRQVQVRYSPSHWQLVAGAQVLCDFGTDESAARQALRVVQEFRMSERTAFGEPNPVFSYFTANGKLPHQVGFGVSALEFNPGTVRISRQDGAWLIIDGDRVVWNFGDREREARRLLEVVRREQPTCLAWVGQPAANGLTFLVRRQ